MGPNAINAADLDMWPEIVINLEVLSVTAAIKKDTLLGIVLKVTGRCKCNAINVMKKVILQNSAEVFISINFRLRN